MVDLKEQDSSVLLWGSKLSDHGAGAVHKEADVQALGHRRDTASQALQLLCIVSGLRLRC